MTYKLVNKEKIKIIMICAHAQCKQKQTNILQSRTCWLQVQIRSASKAVFHEGRISLPVHYFICLFNKHVKTLQE